HEANGSVYFDVDKYHRDFSDKGQPYGILSGRILEEQLETTRALDNQDEKRNRADFALWKKAPAEHIMRWQSPWGEGFPGWHIECSAMSSKYLGTEFDIHGGGMDLQFPHHECEIAQSTVANHVMPARYWIHNNMITINGKKMGKSYNNVIKLSELFSGSHPLLQQAYSPVTVRFFILQSHYRGTLDFSNEALQAAEKAFRRLWESYQWLLKQGGQKTTAASNVSLAPKIKQLLLEMDEFMNDDLNTAKVLANLFELSSIINSWKDGHLAADAVDAETLVAMQQQMKRFLEDIFGLQQEQETSGGKLDGVLQLLIDIRKDAKAKKDFVTSDKIRQELSRLGVQLKDEKDGSVSYQLA
ncbi:MAG: cysteine--tRNA ligase, partial [Chitinophagaceae bacterium]|nr:cysteine--tRNA ligase [Chitinophagaceae bacterium]